MTKKARKRTSASLLAGAACLVAGALCFTSLAGSGMASGPMSMKAESTIPLTKIMPNCSKP